MARIIGTSESDTLIGTEEADVIIGRARNDTIRGGGGDDTIEGSKGNDEMDGGEGFDFVSFKNAAVGIRVFVPEISGISQSTNLGFDTVNNFEGALGSDFGDALQGGSGGQELRGRGGDDVFVGGGGADTLAGGKGDEIYEYFDGSDADGDVVTNFSRKDMFDFGGADADLTQDGNQNFRFIGDDEFRGRAGQLRFEVDPDRPGGYLVQGDLDGDGAADFELTIERAAAEPTREDFFL